MIYLLSSALLLGENSAAWANSTSNFVDGMSIAPTCWMASSSSFGFSCGLKIQRAFGPSRVPLSTVLPSYRTVTEFWSKIASQPESQRRPIDKSEKIL